MPRPKNTEIRVYVVEYGRDELMFRIKHPDGKIEHESREVCGDVVRRFGLVVIVIDPAPTDPAIRETNLPNV